MGSEVETQIWQGNSLRVVMQAVSELDYSQTDETALISEARKRLGREVALSVEDTSALSCTAAGKLRLVVRT